MPRKKRDDESQSLFTPKQKLQIRIGLFLLSLVSIVIFLYTVRGIATNMTTGIAANSEAQQAIMKTCTKLAGESGLKNNEYQKFWSQCVADGQAKLKEKKR